MAEHTGRTPVADATVPGRIFVGVGIDVGVMAALYAATAYEEAGTAMLALASVLSLWAGVYLLLQQRRAAAPESSAVDDDAYLPHASVCPLAIGAGAALALNGLLVGGWFWFPGVAVLAVAVGGFTRQSRQRS